ncbi:MAG: type II secretion system F family protein [Planctomycetaceae bacterium]|nr:type II secretion system F family protein [Planctomycetaceae bacterium]
MNNSFSTRADSGDGPGVTGSAPHVPATVSLLTSGGLSLEAGLRALSEETPSRRLRRVLRTMSHELERGQPLDEVLSRSGTGMPGYLRGLVRGGIETGRLGSFLEQFLQSVRRRRAAALTYWGLLAYPLLLLPLAFLVGMAILGWIVPQFRDIFNDFGVSLPAITVFLVQLSEPRVWISLGLGVPAVVLLLTAALVGSRFLPGHAARLHAFQMIPLIGTPSRMRGLSEFCSMLGLLVSGRIPLPEALQMTGAAVHDANLRQGARRLAARIEQGESLERAACGLPQISSELRHLFRWAPRGDAFGDILLRAGEVFSTRSRVQAGLAIMLIQPLVFFGVGLFLGFVVLALFLPLIKLLNGLA